jgi:hypothetical protein
MTNPAASQIQYTYVTCPIFLTGGIAGSLEGGTIPIISLLNPGAFPSGLGSVSGPDFDLDDAFAQFHAMPGASLQNYDLGRYPFANQVTAANAIITEPLNISMTMIVAFKPGNSNVSNRQSVMTSLKQTLDQHALAGGTYVVNTVSYPYQNAILKGLHDSSSAEVEIPQWRWVWDFEIPLISLEDANNVVQRYSNLMGRMSSGQVVQPNASGSITWSGTAPTVGNPASGASSILIPSASSAPTLGRSSSPDGPP